MATAGSIVKVWTERGQMCMSVRVNEGTQGNVEYIGRVPLADILALPAVAGDLSDVASNPAKQAAVKAALQAAIKVVRDADPIVVAAAAAPLAGITGNVSL